VKRGSPLHAHGEVVSFPHPSPLPLPLSPTIQKEDDDDDGEILEIEAMKTIDNKLFLRRAFALFV
jgi:hypothetical protein